MLESILSRIPTGLSYLLYAVIVIIFILLGVYVYNRYYGRDQKKFSDVANEDGEMKTARLYFFNVDWCPHCVKAKPAWQEFCEKNDKKVFGDYRLECVGGVEGTNCTDEDDEEMNKLLSEFNVEGYPTVKLVKDGEKIEYGTKISKETLEQFVSSVLKA